MANGLCDEGYFWNAKMLSRKRKEIRGTVFSPVVEAVRKPRIPKVSLGCEYKLIFTGGKGKE